MSLKLPVVELCVFERFDSYLVVDGVECMTVLEAAKRVLALVDFDSDLLALASHSMVKASESEGLVSDAWDLVNSFIFFRKSVEKFRKATGAETMPDVFRVAYMLESEDELCEIWRLASQEKG